MQAHEGSPHNMVHFLVAEVLQATLCSQLMYNGQGAIQDSILGKGGIHTAGGSGGHSPQTLKGICIIRQLSLPFLIIHNTLSQCKYVYSGSRFIMFSLCVIHAVSK